MTTNLSTKDLLVQFYQNGKVRTSQFENPSEAAEQVAAEPHQFRSAQRDSSIYNWIADPLLRFVMVAEEKGDIPRLQTFYGVQGITIPASESREARLVMIARTGEDLLTKNFIMLDGNCFKKVVMTFMSQDDVNTLGATPLRLQMKDIKDKNGEPLTKEAISWEGEEGDSSDSQLVYLGKICAVPPTYNTHHGHPLRKPLPEDPAEGPKTCPKFRAVFEG